MVETPGQFVAALGVSMVSAGQPTRATKSSWSGARVAGPWGTGSGAGRERRLG